MSKLHSVEIKNTTRGTLPDLPFEKLARRILGSHYQLSLVICADTLAMRINRKYRRKIYSPNVLSFPLTEVEGEIFLNIRKAEREARKYGVSQKKREALLFVHGILHLKGMKHGRTMERTEQRVLRGFGLSSSGTSKERDLLRL